jgi:class 3 adenylate cyclase
MKTLAPSVPRHRAIVAVDVEASTTRTNAAKVGLRQAMYDLLEQALDAAGIARRYRDPLIDRGDGVLALVHPVDQAPKTLLLNAVIPRLSELLADHRAHCPDQQFRLRAVVHAGEVHYDGRGVFGEALDIAFRLLDALEVKKRLLHTAAPLVLVASDDIYRTVIRHGYDGINDQAFEPLVRVHVAGQQHCGWVHVPQPRE